MDFSKFENSVSQYTGTVKEKFLIVNGNAVSVKNKTDENTENITGLISEIAQLRQYVDEADNSIHGDISAVNQNVTKLKADTSVLRNDLDTLHASCNFTFNGIIADVSTLKDWKTSHTTDYNALVTADTQINSSISDIKNTINDIIFDVSTFNSSVNDWKSSHTTQYNALVTADTQINSSISGIKTDVTNINSSISGIKSDVSSLQSWKDTIDNGCLVDVDSLKSDVSALQTWKTSHEKEFKAFDTSVSTYRNLVDIKFVNIESNVNNLLSDVSTLNAWKTSHTTQYNTLVSKDTEIDSSITSIKSDVSTLNAWKTSHTTQYNALVTKDSQIDSSISALKTKDTQIDSSISSLKSLVGTTADSSTMNTLFGMLKRLQEQVDENEQVVAQSLVDLDARLLAVE